MAPSLLFLYYTGTYLVTHEAVQLAFQVTRRSSG